MKKAWIACSLLALAACKGKPQTQSGTATPDTGGVAVVAIAKELDYTNGLLSGDRTSQEINRYALFLPLIQYDADLQLKPLLAESWQMEGDTAVVFKLRNDVKWHDGVRTSAYDVAFTYNYGIDPKTEYPNGDYWVGWNAATVIDSFTIRFSITPQPDALANLPFIPVMPAHLLDSIKPEAIKTAAFNQKPVGNGPFKFAEHRANDRWVLEANRDYPVALGGRPPLDRIVFRIVPDETAEESELISGGADLITTVRPERIDELAKKPGLRAIRRPGRQFTFVGWNGKKKPLDDARVRRALTMAMNRERMLQVIRHGNGEVAVGPVPGFHWSADANLKPLPYAPDSAKALLAQAGLKDLNGDGVLEGKDGKPFTIELKVPSSNKQNADLAELVRADLAAVGVKVMLRILDFNTVIGDIMSPKRKFEAVLMGWESDFRPVLHDMFHSKEVNSPFAFASYSNPEVDSLLDKVESTPSKEATAPSWRRLQLIVRDEQPWSFLFYYSDVFAARDRLQGVDMDIRGAFVNLPSWWVKK